MQDPKVWKKKNYKIDNNKIKYWETYLSESKAAFGMASLPASMVGKATPRVIIMDWELNMEGRAPPWSPQIEK